MSDLPKLLSLKQHDPLYTAQFDVFLNDVKQKCCIIADVEKGMILRYKHSIGSVPSRGRSGKYETETVHGVVRIERKPPPKITVAI